MEIQGLELTRHFPVARHHIKQTDQSDDGGVGRAQEQKKEHDADDPAKSLTGHQTKAFRAKVFRDEAKSVFITKSKRFTNRVRAVGELNGIVRIHRQHGPAEQRRAQDHFNRNGPDGSGCFAADARFGNGCALVELHHAGEIRDRFHAAERENYADELHPKMFVTCVRCFEIRRRQMRQRN